METNQYEQMLSEARESPEYWVEGAILEFTEELCRLMDEQEVNRAELARRVKKSRSYITKVLRGDANFTLATMTNLARALGAEVKMHLAPEGVVVRWQELGILDEQVRPANVQSSEIGFVSARYLLREHSAPNVTTWVMTNAQSAGAQSVGELELRPHG